VIKIVGQIIVALLGMAVLIAGVVAVWYTVGLLVLRAVSFLFPLAGGKRRKKGR
jgi:hypothetical protein